VVPYTYGSEGTYMPASKKIHAHDLERRELQLTLFACIAIAILATGTAILMYPVVFSRQTYATDKALPIAFVGFCILSVLLAGYLWERQATIRRLRKTMAQERMHVAAAQRQASTELLKTMPNFSSFQDRLPMEYRRTVATTQKLSILVVSLSVNEATSVDALGAPSLMGDAAKVISRKLREQDSIYILGATCFGAVLPGADLDFTRHVYDRVAEGLADAAGANNRFSYKIDIVNYPADANSAHDLEGAVRALLPADDSMQAMAQAII
jgi:GGDEF domain-containing protein